MATYSQEEIKKALNALFAEEKSLEEIVSAINKKSVVLLNKDRKRLGLEPVDEKQVRGKLKEVKQTIKTVEAATGDRDASAAVERLQKVLNSPAEIKRLGATKAQIQKQLSAARQTLREKTPTGNVDIGVDLTPYVTATVQDGDTFRPSAGVGESISQMGGTAARRGTAATGGTTTTGTGGLGGGGGVPLTPEEKAANRKERKDGRFEKAAAEFRKMAPQYAWILDIDQAKYPDVRKLIQRAIKDGMFESPEGLQRFIGELNGTTFFSELREKGTKQKIVNLVGDLGFDDSNMGKLLANATNLQWDDDTLSLEVYKEAFRKNEDGTYVHSQAQARAKKSSSYLRVQNIGTSFFNQLDDDTVERVLTGGMIEDDVLRQQRELAKARYGHLSNLIDQGLSLDAITRSYRDEAARLLERDPNDVRMADAMYQTAYDFTDESGQKRLMTTGEWTRQLRTDTQYGWDKTENAKREAQQLSSSIIQAFGRVM